MAVTIKYPLSDVSIKEHEIAYVTDAITRGQVSGTGDYVPRFEELLAYLVNRQHAIATANGTVALEVALRALGVGAGHEVIVPAYTFVSPAAAVRNVGAVPVLVDVTRENWTLDPALIRQAMTTRTRAIIAVDLLGHPAALPEIQKAAAHTPIIEDAAQAHGAALAAPYPSKACGSLGVISTFSFHANKAVSCGEGGAILTDDPKLAATIRLMVNHGMSRDRPYYHSIVGTNARLNNLSAALGLAQLERWGELVERRIYVDQFYRKALRSQNFRPHSRWAVPSVCLSALTVEHKDSILKALRSDHGVDSRALWTALCDLPIYREGARFEYPVSRELANSVICLPTSATLTEDDLGNIVQAFRKAHRVSQDDPLPEMRTDPV